MMKILFSAFLFFSFHSLAWAAIFGSDDRHEVYDFLQPDQSTVYAEALQGTVAMIAKNRLSDAGDGKTQITYKKLGQFKFLKYEGLSLCPDEKFLDQMAAAECSGFLIGSKYIMTAGHCQMEQNDCSGYNWVFNYVAPQNDLTAEKILLDSSEIYSCKNIIGHTFNEMLRVDYTLVELDREVVGHRPLKVRKRGSLDYGTSIFTVGSQLGLPLKITDGAQVLYTTPTNYFGTNLDIFNSGGPVVNLKTGLVEGVASGSYGSSLAVDEDQQCVKSLRHENIPKGYNGIANDSLMDISRVDTEEMKDLLRSLKLY